jgi:hypothetical protein
VPEARPEVQHAQRASDARGPQHRVRRPGDRARLLVEPGDLRVVASQDISRLLTHGCSSLAFVHPPASRGWVHSLTAAARSAAIRTVAGR